MKIGLIGGHKIPSLIKNEESIVVETKYGNVSVESSSIGEHKIFFINRHGKESNIPPHKINYLANIDALAASHVSCILSIGTVGSMKKSIKPGDFVIPHDFIDFTKSRIYTFFDGKRVHIDMTDPYCPSLRETMIDTAKKTATVPIHERGVYLATEGPRLETATEIRYFSQFADIVGMTGVPETVLAREMGICYASICVVCNMATGIQKRLTADEISNLYKKQEPILADFLRNIIKSLHNERTCKCKNILSKAIL